MFQLLDEDELKELLAETEERSYVAGQTIFSEGQPGGEMHVVLEGRVETFLVDDEGHRVILAEVERGEMFGELSLFDNEPRSASAVALEPTRTCIVDRKDLERLFARKPPAALDILAMLSRRLPQHRPAALAAGGQEPERGDRGGEHPGPAARRRGGPGRRLVGLHQRVHRDHGRLDGAEPLPPDPPFDPAPFIGLNLLLSMLAALQAPVIMMSQNRQDAKDRVRADLDYQVNLKAEIEIMELHKKVDRMKDELVEPADRGAGRAEVAAPGLLGRLGTPAGSWPGEPRLSSSPSPRLGAGGALRGARADLAPGAATCSWPARPSEPPFSSPGTRGVPRLSRGSRPRPARPRPRAFPRPGSRRAGPRRSAAPLSRPRHLLSTSGRAERPPVPVRRALASCSSIPASAWPRSTSPPSSWTSARTTSRASRVAAPIPRRSRHARLGREIR